MDEFSEIIKHLNRKRPSVPYRFLDKNTMEFTVGNKYYDKYFRIHFQDSDTEDRKESKFDTVRPRHHHYNIYFRQDNVPLYGILQNIVDSRWFYEEEDAVAEIKRLCKNWQK